MPLKNYRRKALQSKIIEQEEQFKKELAKIYLEYLESLSLNKRIKEMASLICETEVKRVIVLDKRLTRREKQCLLLAYHGKNVRETSEILNIKIRTTEWYRKRILKKTNAKNIGHAIALGIKYQYFPSANQFIIPKDN